MNKKWDRDALEKKLRELDYWHFLIEFEPGIFNIPQERWEGVRHNIIVQNYMTRTLFPILGMLDKNAKADTTIIDIGCNEGWLSLLLHRAGYKRIVGIDPNEGNIKRALFLKEYFDMKDVDFYCVDINDFKTEERFDFAIMLGVINHTHSPIGILQKIYDITNDYLIMDFDSLCNDYTESSPEPKFDTGLSDVFGNMKCYFERANQMTSYENNNLVFQYSKKAMQMMMNFVGFHDVFQILPRISTPPHYKNEKRVFLAGRKHKNKNYFEHEIMLDKEYMEALKCSDKPIPDSGKECRKDLFERIKSLVKFK